MLDRDQQAIQILEMLADHYGVRIDRSVANRWLSTANMVSDDDVVAWLVSTGNRVGLRLGFYDCHISDVVAFARQRIPVVVAPQEASGATRWMAVMGLRWGRLRVRICNRESQMRSISRRKFSRLAALGNDEERVRCLVAQPVIAGGGGKAEPIKPLKRLLGLFRPDFGDLWSMVIFSIIVGVLTLAAPLAVEALVNTVAFGRYLQPILMLALLLMVFLAFAAGLRALLAVVAEVVQRRLLVRVSEDLGYRLPRVDSRGFDGHNPVELVNRFLDVATVQKTSSFLLLDGIALVVSAVIGMAVLGFYHPFLLGFDIVLLSMMAFTVFVLGRGAVETAQKESKAKFRLTGWLEDLVRCPTAFSMHGGSRFAMERTDRLAVDYLDYRRKHFRVLMRQICFALAMQAVASTVLLGLGGYLVIIGELTLGQLVAAELIVTVVVGAFAKMGKHMESYYDMLASVDKLGVLLDLPLEDQGGPSQVESAGPMDLSVRDLVLRAQNRQLVDRFSATAARGGTTAVVGPAGIGKSLLIDTIAGRCPPHSGSIEIEGMEVDQLDTESLRQQIGVAREVEIFEGTVAENIHLYRPNIRGNDVHDALEKVGLLAEVRRLPDGVDTVLTSDSRPLSRDQALRLMVARAIVGRPRMLLIDGTLDGLPDTTAYETLLQLTESPQPWSLVIATGRAAIRAHADQVWDLAQMAKPVTK
jgi:ABC-type bacteriocin/lantibiotic exporter with double-glycine peptidase domain